MKKCRQELFVKGSEMFEMLGDFYKLNKLIINGDEQGVRTDAYFEWCGQQADKFCKKHPTRYAKALARTLMEEIEYRFREEREEENKSGKTAA